MFLLHARSIDFSFVVAVSKDEQKLQKMMDKYQKEHKEYSAILQNYCIKREEYENQCKQKAKDFLERNWEAINIWREIRDWEERKWPNEASADIRKNIATSRIPRILDNISGFYKSNMNRKNLLVDIDIDKLKEPLLEFEYYKELDVKCPEYYCCEFLIDEAEEV